MCDGYGQTETSALVANYRSMEVRPGSMGKPVPGWDVDVVDDDGAAVAPGTVGHMVVRTAPDRPVGLFPGYHGAPEATAEAFRVDGLYFTGDKAANPVIKHGSQEMKERLLPKIVSGEMHVCFGVTEPDAGLDTTATKTFAKLNEDGRHYTYYKEARLLKLAPLPQEMVLNYVGEHVLGLPRSY